MILPRHPFEPFHAPIAWYPTVGMRHQDNLFSLADHNLFNCFPDFGNVLKICCQEGTEAPVLVNETTVDG